MLLCAPKGIQPSKSTGEYPESAISTVPLYDSWTLHVTSITVILTVNGTSPIVVPLRLRLGAIVSDSLGFVPFCRGMIFRTGDCAVPFPGLGQRALLP